jgi:AsmA protein
MTLKLTGAATGATDDELLRTLDGTLDFALADGVYRGLDVWYEIRRARALIRRQPPPAQTGAEETPIRALELAGRLADGVLKTERFGAEIPFLRVSGDATVDLPDAVLDSRLTALVYEKPVFGDDTSLEDLVGMRLPLTISGPVADPKVGVDLSRMVRDVVKESVRRSLEEKLREKLGVGQEPAAEPGAEGEQAAPPPEDPVNQLLDRLFKKK